MSIKKFVAPGVLVAVVAGALLTAGPVGARARGLVAEVKDASGNALGMVRFVPAADEKVLVTARLSGLTPGFHGFHVHAVGTCDPEAKDATGATVPFLSAGGHYNPVTENTHGAHAGDMAPLLVSEDGTALLKFKTDRFRNRDLRDADGSAVIVHAGADNLANIPAATPTGDERYHSHVDDVFGADSATKATGDAGARSGCGQIVKPTN